MATSYVPVNRDQVFLLPPSLREWVADGHLVWTVIDAVEACDFSVFDLRRSLGGRGRPPFDPRMMVAVLLYGAAVGANASREIARRCGSDAAFRIACADVAPGYSALMMFRREFAAELEAMFGQVLAVCARSGMGRVGTIAIDGTRLRGNANGAQNRTAAQIADESARRRADAGRLVAAGRDADLADDRLFGEDRSGDEVPAVLADPRTRRGRLAAAAAALAAEQAAADRAERDRREVRARAEREAAAEGRKLSGRKPKPPRPPKPPRVNVTDPDSRVMKTAGGFVQGYNAQACVDESQLIIACAVTNDNNDASQLEPMIAAVIEHCERTQIGTAHTVVADAGYFTDANATAMTGPRRLISPRNSTGTFDPDGPTTPQQRMRIVMRTDDALHHYALRSQTVEPVFGQMKHRLGLTQLLRRGIAKAGSDWAVTCTAHNLLKLHAARTA